MEVHGCMNFCVDTVLHVDVWEKSKKIEFLTVFNTTPRARICMNFQTVFAYSELVVSSG